MPITASFTASQTLGLPSIITLTDTSTGSDATVTARRVYLQKADGTYLTPAGILTDYIVWPLDQASIDIDALDRDYALNIVVTHVTASGTAVASAAQLKVFAQHLELFDYTLTENEASDPRIVSDTRYFASRIELRVKLDAAANAIRYGNDIYGAQAMLDKAQFLMDRQNLYF
jgi:hypothetical protein